MKSKTNILIIFLPLLFLTFYVPDACGKENVRGLWVVRHSLVTPAGIDSLISLARKCGITDLFIQVRGRGDAYYTSQHESLAEEIKWRDFDPLAYLLEKTRTERFRIHAWLNVFYIWSKDTLPRDQNHIVNRQSQWLARSVRYSELILNYPSFVKQGQVEGLFVSPLQPQAQQHFLNILGDLLSRYALDGIHLDYIRYPDQSFDIHPDVVKGFRNRYIINPEQFLTQPEKFAEQFSIPGYEVFYHHWRRYLMDGLSNFVKRISDIVRTHSGEIILSAAVKPDIIQAHWNFYQDWDRWVKKGWLDWAIPMNYASDPKLFRKNIDQYLDQIPTQKYLIGIALYNQSSDLAIRKIAQVTALDNPGFVLFSYTQLQKSVALQRYLIRLAAESGN